MWTGSRESGDRWRAPGALPSLDELSFDVSFGALLDETHLLSAVLLPDGRVLDASERALAFAGTQRDEVVGLPLWDTALWETVADRQRVKDALGLAALGETVRFAAAPRRHDGLLVAVGFTARAVKGRDGDVRFLLVDGEEPFERRTANETCEESAASLRAILDTAVDAIVSIDEFGRVEGFNRSAEAIFGYTSAEILGENVRLLMPEPEGSNHDSYIARYVDTGEPRVIGTTRSIVGRRKDGTSVRLELSLGDSRIDGRRRFVGILRDVSERTQAADDLRVSEARLGRARELAHIGVIEASAPFRPEDTDWSDEVYRIFGRDPARGPASMAQLQAELAHPADREAATRAFAYAVAEGRPAIIELRALRADGATRIVQARFGAELDEHGEASRWIGAIRDVTDQRALEAELLHAQKMEALARFTAGIAHEYNNLLMGIQGCTKLALRRIGDDHEGARFVVEAERAAKRGAALTRQLLDFSRRQELAEGAVDLDAVIARTEVMLRAVLGERIELSLRFGAPRWRPAGDPAQLEQVIVNLALNARDAMPEGGSLVIETSEISLSEEEATAEPGEYVVLSVTDTGTGMDAQARERAFEPFFTTKQNGERTGLGLATVYGIVRKGGGDVALESEPGRGTTVSLFLPRVEEEAGTVPERADAPRPASARRGKGRLLVVEDEPLIRLTLRGFLEPHGYEVVEACDLSEASLYLKRAGRPFDLVLTDVMLPGGTGRQVAEEARLVDPALPVIFMSAHSAHLLLKSGRIPARSVLLQKPFGEDDLMAEIDRALGPGHLLERHDGGAE